MKTILCPCGMVRKADEVCQKCNRGKKNRIEGTTAERGYDRDWRLLSESIRKDRPLCEDCLARNLTTPATECHHILKIKDAPKERLNPSNVMSLCSECHRIRTERGE